MKKGPPAPDVDTYLAALPKKERSTLEKLRKTIRAAAPTAEEVISYRIPAFKHHGPLVFFAALKDHCSLFVVNKQILKKFSAELRPYHTSGTTIHFSPEIPFLQPWSEKLSPQGWKRTSHALNAGRLMCLKIISGSRE